MRQICAHIGRAWDASGRWLLSPLGTRLALITLLGTQAGLLAYSATRHSPTYLEPAFLASGISHWQYGRFELYRVNPPLPRMIASLPVLVVGCKTDWTSFFDCPGSRAEFSIGEDFIKANGPDSQFLFSIARWACIPFSLIGGFFAYLWSNELYGKGAGLITLTLWTFEPNLLAHAELITPDCACWSFGILAGYTYWRWLTGPTWKRATTAGICLGLAQLTKFTWIILFGLWPLLWVLWITMNNRSNHRNAIDVFRLNDCNHSNTLTNHAELSKHPRATKVPQPTVTRISIIQHPAHVAWQFGQLTTLILLSIYILNLGYGCDGTLVRLGDLTFVSRLFTGLEKAGLPGNRFKNTMLDRMPIPVPKQYLLGIDSQKKDFESWSRPSYLRGKWKQGGWWYYYIYGLCVKVPCGLLVLLTGISIGTALGWPLTMPQRDDLVLMAPAVAVILLASLQTEFSEHLRYVYPSLAMLTVACGKSINWIRCRSRLLAIGPMLLIAHSTTSCISNYPNQLAYFNELAGGPENGWRHLLGSSFDWGQDLLAASQWSETMAASECAPSALLYSGTYDWFDVSNSVEFVDEPLVGGGLSFDGRTLIMCRSLWAEEIAIARRPGGTALVNVDAVGSLIMLHRIEGKRIRPTLDVYCFPD